ncbi:MAG: thiosulfate/3-mercaptopyruvate sulfurtransferase [Pseudomonadota bacterium]|jgi:thiosulfate/3-mercaptopyruvate sulfurtransferase
MKTIQHLIAVILLSLISFGGAAWAQSGTIVDLQYVKAAQQRGAIIWDVRASNQYLEGHIPGAINFGDIGTVLRDPNREDFIDLAEINAIFNKAGLDIYKEIVVYGSRGNPYSYFGLFTIHYFGGKQAKVFHDGIDGWADAGLPIEKTSSTLASINIKLAPQENLVVSNEQMRKLYNNQSVQVVDARTFNEFKGNDVRAIRGGHIPGAISIPYEQNWKDPATGSKLAKKEVKTNAGMSLKTKDELNALYAKLDPNKETVVYCQSGVRAAETATVLQNLGYKNVKIYDSSWLGWASHLASPVADETYLNVGMLNARIAAMQNKINELETALKGNKN